MALENIFISIVELVHYTAFTSITVIFILRIYNCNGYFNHIISITVLAIGIITAVLDSLACLVPIQGAPWHV